MAGGSVLQTGLGDRIIETITQVQHAIVPMLVLIVGLVLGLVLSRFVRGFLIRVGIPNAVEGTPFERTARRFGTSTVGIFSLLVLLFVYALTIGLTLELAGLLQTGAYVPLLQAYLPSVFVAALVFVLGLVIGDKAALGVQEHLEGVKLSQVSLLPPLVKYTIVFVAILIALAQLGVATSALIVVLGVYGLALIVFGGLAFKHLLAASAAGMYMLLTQPYGIGDKVEVDGHRGIVQEVDVFVTRIENESEEFIVPNDRVFRSGIVRIRD